MTIDQLDKLKSLAERTTPGLGGLFSSDTTSYMPNLYLINPNDVAYFTAVSPDVVLELVAEMKELHEEVKTLRFNLEQKSREIGRSEHRGNTVDYIYDKLENYSNQLLNCGNEVRELRAENDKLTAQVKKIRGENGSIQFDAECLNCEAVITLRANSTASPRAELDEAREVIEATEHWAVIEDVRKKARAYLEKYLK